jgi:3-deoxy-D-manno-octulosonic-acid transferase
MRRFIRHWQPDAALIIESELWPNMLGKLRKWKIPCALINARMSEKSARGWESRAPLWIASLLHIFHLVLAQSKADALRLQRLGAYGARCMGNLKLAAEPLPFDRVKFDDLKNQIGDRPVWLMASTHEGDEDLACAVHKILRRKHPDLLTVIVPRHPKRADAIEKNLARHERCTPARRSRGEHITPATGIYLADTFAELGLFYRLIKINCIGGSFSHIGGHNPFEAAQLGGAIIFGPDMRNNSGISTAMLEAGAAKQVSNEASLCHQIQEWLDNPTSAAEAGEKAQAYANKEGGALKRILAELSPLLDKALHHS